jgi:hypothetical protein
MYKEVASLASSILKHHDNNILTIATQQDMLESAGYGPPSTIQPTWQNTRTSSLTQTTFYYTRTSSLTRTTYSGNLATGVGLVKTPLASNAIGLGVWI